MHLNGQNVQNGSCSTLAEMDQMPLSNLSPSVEGPVLSQGMPGLAWVIQS